MANGHGAVRGLSALDTIEEIARVEFGVGPALDLGGGAGRTHGAGLFGIFLAQEGTQSGQLPRSIRLGNDFEAAALVDQHGPLRAAEFQLQAPDVAWRSVGIEL